MIIQKKAFKLFLLPLLLFFLSSSHVLAETYSVSLSYETSDEEPFSPFKGISFEKTTKKDLLALFENVTETCCGSTEAILAECNFILDSLEITMLSATFYNNCLTSISFYGHVPREKYPKEMKRFENLFRSRFAYRGYLPQTCEHIFYPCKKIIPSLSGIRETGTIIIKYTKFAE